jgi:hypothetical protein
LVVSDFANAHICYFGIVFGKPVQRKNETIHLIIRGRDLTFKGRPLRLQERPTSGLMANERRIATVLSVMDIAR